MHDCQRFREDLADLIPDELLPVRLEFCEDCRRFYEEAAALFKTMDCARASVPEMSETYWAAFDDRLRQNLLRTNPVASGWSSGAQQWLALAAASLLVAVVTWIAVRATQPLVDALDTIAVANQVQVDDVHIQGLDPQVVDFLGQSELFLRSFTKIEPSDIPDIEDARNRAVHQLSRLDQPKAAVADFVPVRMALDEYESVLREIKNLDSTDEIFDIQDRIQRNGLIANMKVYQPRLVWVADTQ